MGRKDVLHESDRAEIGSVVRAKRKALGMSQEAVARELGVSWNTVQRLEAGDVLDPHLSTLRGLARALDTTVAELVGERPECL